MNPAWIVALVLLLVSFVIAAVRQSISAEVLALWAIAAALILPHFLK